MQTVGVNKCKLKNLKYYNRISKDSTMDISDLSASQISSIIIDTSIENMDYIKNISCLKVLININLRIIYSKCEDNSLYVCEKNLLDISYIEVDNCLDGIDTNLTFIKNKIKCEIYTENLSYKLLNNKLLSLNYVVITNLKVNPSFCLAYCISNNFFDNIFLSYGDGKNLTQYTFSMDLNYSNICWQSNGSNIVFLGYREDLYTIHILDYNNKNTNNIISVNVNNIVNSFSFYKSNSIILSIKEDNKDLLYTLNLKQRELRKFNISNNIHNYLKPYYYESINTLFCLCKLNEIYCLCSLDKNNNLSILFNFANVLDYYVSEKLNKVFVHVAKGRETFFYILDLENKNLNPVNFDFPYDEILKFKYVTNKQSQEIILVLYSYNSKTYLSSFDVNNFSSTIIYSEDTILDFDINLNTYDIFVTVSNNIFSQVIKITPTGHTEILKIPSNIKSVYVK